MRRSRPALVGPSATVLVSWVLALSAGCATSGSLRTAGPVVFDMATVWVVQGDDSASVAAEIARTAAQHEIGLAERRSLDSGSGMLFLFSEMRTEEDGFWMWRTWMPLDLAFIDERGAITQVLSMEPCADQTADQDCPGYFPDAPYASALEVNQGWFAERGLGAGASVRVVR
jgi:uncharacterized membrane protein (UPF0127 family)